MERAWTAYHEQAVVSLLDNLNGLFAAFQNGRKRGGRGGELRGEELRGNERVVSEDLGVVCVSDRLGRVILEGAWLDAYRARRRSLPEASDLRLPLLREAGRVLSLLARSAEYGIEVV